MTVRANNPDWTGSQSDLQQGIPQFLVTEGTISEVKVYNDYGYVVNGKQYGDGELTKKGGRRHTRSRRRASRRGFRV